ncbi:unnamed protein product [Owenia fusiformis]|uniref:Uncharacterized protein n=1 Tax=Owenia fusiformis TaxID=6347 RepID=A0A8J1TR17_OWEFU|nr:unnamed protein product [Owenia fusiformis]
MDLLGSILGSMEKPPTMDEEQRKKAKAQKEKMEKIQKREKETLNKFREKTQKMINDFIKDSSKQKYKFEPMDKVYRAVVHEVADIAGLVSFSFGQDEVDRYCLVWKKEFAPSDDELAALRKGEEYDPLKAKELARLKDQEAAEARQAPKRPATHTPNADYHNKYEHILGKTSAKDAARLTTANKNYGFVPSSNKKDLRTIEQVMADSKAKRQKVEDVSQTETDVSTEEHKPDTSTSAGT